MKYLMVILMLVSYQGCAQTSDAVITYHAETRGFYYHLQMNKDNMTLQKTRGDEKGQQMKLTVEQWNQIKDILDKIEVSEMENMKSDSSRSAVDAAAMANLKVELADDNVHSCSFDHGYPPKELEQLVKAILSLAETVEKQ